MITSAWMPMRILMPPARKNMTVNEGRGVSTKYLGKASAPRQEIGPGEEELEVKHRKEREQAQAERPQAEPAEEVKGPLSIALEKADQDQVEDDVERAAQAVFGAARGAWAMVDDQLDDPCALPGREDRDESVHLAVKPHALQHAAAVGLQRAAEIVRADAGEPGDQAVGEPRGNLARDQSVLAILSPARNDVVTGVDLVEQPGNVRRVVLAVAVDGNEDLTARLVERGRQGRGLTAVTPQQDDPHMLRVAALDQVELGRRSVGRAVIDKDQLILQRSGRRTESSSACSGSTLSTSLNTGIKTDRSIGVVISFLLDWKTACGH